MFLWQLFLLNGFLRACKKQSQDQDKVIYLTEYQKTLNTLDECKYCDIFNMLIE